MKNKIKRIVAITMTVAAFSVIQPIGTVNYGVITAYAASLNSLEMKSSGGSDVNLYENDNYTKELKSGDSIESTYYAKVSSDNSKVKFNTNGFSGTVKIVKDKSKKVYDEGQEIPVLTGKTSFYIRLYDNFDTDKPDDYKSQYRVIVKKYTSEEEEKIKNDDQGNIYLKNIELDYGDTPLGFDSKKTTYDVKVGADVKSMVIKAVPDDGATTVKINNITVDENDEYKKTVNLGQGNNKIEITLSQEDEDKRTYIVNINRGGSSNSAVINSDISTADTNNKAQTVNTTENKENSTIKNENTINTQMPNKWVQVLGKWKYNDGYGNPIKNAWYYDSVYGKNYYFDDYGNMVTGWKNINNSWYYLNNDGGMAVGWKQIGYNWYYLNYDGKMKTGWFEDFNGKYYYLNEPNGDMAYDTTVGKYKLGSNGAWIK